MNNFTYSRIPSKLLITLTPVIIPRYYYLFVIPKSKKNFFPSKQLAQLFLPLLSFPFDAARLFFALLENRESRDEIKRERKKEREKERKRKGSYRHFSARGNASCVGFGWCIVNLGAVSGRMPAAAPRKVKFAHDNAANFSRKSGGTVCARSSSPSFYGALRLPRFLSYSRLPPRWTGRGRGIGEKRIYTSRGWNTSGVNLSLLGVGTG